MAQMRYRYLIGLCQKELGKVPAVKLLPPYSAAGNPAGIICGRKA